MPPATNFTPPGCLAWNEALRRILSRLFAAFIPGGKCTFVTTTGTFSETGIATLRACSSLSDCSGARVCSR